MTTKHGFHFTDGNEKMLLVGNFSLVPHATCNAKAPCVAKGCYAWRFFRRMPTVRKAWGENTQLLVNEGKFEEFIEDTVAYIKMRGHRNFRFSVSGDMFSVEYGVAMCEIAAQCPETRFWTFTKQWDVLRELPDTYGELPGNFNVILSAWNEFQPPADLRSLYATAHFDDDKHKELIPEDAFVCPGGCANCMRCYTAKAGANIVFKAH